MGEVNNYKQLIKNAPFGYAYHKIVLDNLGNLIDYVFIDVNSAFEKLTGLKAENIINKRITEVIPEIKLDSFDWIAFYGEIALNCGEKEFEQYSDSLKRWYKVQVNSSEKFYFTTFFTDITNEKNIINLSKQFLKHQSNCINYQQIIDGMQAISGAKYLAFNLFDKNGLDFTTVALSGVKDHIKKAVEILGFKIVGKKWKHDPERLEKTKASIITRFENIQELTGIVMYKPMVSLLEKNFKIGEVVVVKIIKGDTTLGDFTLLMAEGEFFKNDISVELFAQQVGFFIDKHNAIEELKRSEEKYKSLFEDDLTGDFIISKDGIIKECNSAFVDIFGYSNKDELLGSNIKILYNKQSDFEKNINQLKENKKLSAYEAVRKCKDGRLIHIIENKIASFDQDGEISEIKGYIFDITEQKQAEAEIKLHSKKLEKINAEKDKFFSIISHDLRSPFNSFLGLTQIMAEELPNLTMDEIQKFADSMRKSATNLYRLLENLLEWSQIQQGLIPYNPELIRLLPVVKESVEMILESAKNKQIEIIFDIPPDIEVYAENNSLQTIIRNLVSNAVKFTPKGGNIHIFAKSNPDNSVEISVKDTGIGMKPSMIENLFKLDVSTSRKGTEGELSTGLGLFICKEFIEKHGGKLWVESQEGKGSTFTFLLPFMQ